MNSKSYLFLLFYYFYVQNQNAHTYLAQMSSGNGGLIPTPSISLTRVALGQEQWKLLGSHSHGAESVTSGVCNLIGLQSPVCELLPTQNSSSFLHEEREAEFILR